MNLIEIGIFVSRIEAVCDEMGLVLKRSAFSTNIKDRLDFSCAIFDPHGQLVAQAAHIPVHLGSMAFAMKAVVAAQAWNDGDMLILNDPYKGGTHLPDITMVAPLFHEQVLLGFVVNRAHHANIGATAPGSMPISTHIDQEGVLISPHFIVREGRVDRVYLTHLAKRLGGEQRKDANDDASGSSGSQSINFDQVCGDFSAQISANQVGLARVALLVERLGADRYRAGVAHLNDYGERIARSAIKDIPDGVYDFTDYMDDDGINNRSLGNTQIGADESEGLVDVVIQVRVTVKGGHVDVDFSGSSPQVEGNINCPLSVTAAGVYYVFRCLMPGNTPACAGTFRPITIRAPQGSLLNSQYPAAVAAGNVETSTRVVDALSGALAQALPGVMAAASHGSMNNVAMGHYHRDQIDGELTQQESDTTQQEPNPTQQDWHYYETIGGGMGAGASGGGLSAVQTHMTNTMNTPVESLEMHYPLRIRRYQIRANSGGLGLRPGGHGIVREYEFLQPTQVTLLTERRCFAPWGMEQGESGAVGVNWLNGKKLLAKQSVLVDQGDRLQVSTPGGGGWGKIPP
ncbi:MAG: 5-oxoprolinase [Gammaproteobacteria bacterium]|nr:MAG: 5-oxoprolinase [Gammaproteobacteria bacterium]